MCTWVSQLSLPSLCSGRQRLGSRTTSNHTPDALPITQLTAWKHWRNSEDWPQPITRISCHLQTHAMYRILANMQMDAQCENLATKVSWQCLASKDARFQLPHLHLALSLEVTLFEFCQGIWHQKTRIPGLLCGIVGMIARLAISVEHRLVTDGHDDSWYPL